MLSQTQTQSLERDRASHLAGDALQLIEAGQLDDAARKLREAVSLGPHNSDVRAALMKLHYSQEISPIVNACKKYVAEKDASSGKEVARLLATNDFHPPKDAALEILRLILDRDASSLTSEQDDILVSLIRSSAEMRRHFMAEFHKSPTEFFDKLYDRGDGIVNNLRSIVSDRSLWHREEDRKQAERDLFQLLLAKLMESGHDLDGRSLRNIALLLATDAEAVAPLVDSDTVDAILSCLDIRLSPDVRNQATLATSKYLDAAKEEGHKLFTDFVVSRAGKQKKNDTIIAFSAAASLFPIVPNVIAPLFLTEGFLESLFPSLDRKLKHSKVEDAFLQLLNAACIDPACRTATAKYCTDWLEDMLAEGGEDQQALAATILAKVKTSEAVSNLGENGASAKNEKSIEAIVQLLQRSLTVNGLEETATSLEGLAYASLDPKVKEEIASDVPFLKKLYNVLATKSRHSEIVVGGLSVLSHLSYYLPNLSEEQKKLAQLKAYSNSSKAPPENPLNDDEHVTKRCQALVDTDIMPVLVTCSASTTSLQAKQLIDKIILCLSKTSKNRGKLAQQGAVRLLLHHLNAATGPIEGSSPDASHALARILISVNPTHVFPATGNLQAANAVPCLVSLLKEPSCTASASGGNPLSADGPRDLLPVFESLLALTNLASSPLPSAADIIVRNAWDTVEDLLLHKNTLIQRAACELVCNLAATDSGTVKFADGTKRAQHRLHLMLALAEVEDPATRRAAGGALAMLTEVGEEIIKGILGVQRGTEILLSLVEDDDAELVHRGLFCVENMVQCEGEVGIQAIEVVKTAAGEQVIKEALRKSRDQNLLESGVTILKRLAEVK
ncbi:MAG: hypothetical protein Q9160_001622 [Pyrenula sp. 1 TL-2023]